jgi:hypothetical protein
MRVSEKTPPHIREIKGMMRIIEIVLPTRNLQPHPLDKLDSTALIHNILQSALEYALIPPLVPLTIRPSGVSSDRNRS